MSRFKDINSKNAKGFTIIELLIATSIFSVVLLLCATAIVQIGKQYYRGTIMNRTQAVARSAGDDIVQAIEYGSTSGTFVRVPALPARKVGLPAPGFPVYAVCIGTTRYSYTSARAVGGSATVNTAHGLWKDQIGASTACSAADLSLSTPSANGQDLLGDGMRVATLNVNNLSGKTYSLDFRVSYGPDDNVFPSVSGVPDYTQCLGISQGGQFCATTAISTIVGQRL